MKRIFIFNIYLHEKSILFVGTRFSVSFERLRVELWVYILKKAISDLKREKPVFYKRDLRVYRTDLSQQYP